MTQQALKQEIAKLLEQIEDKALLQQIHQWLQINTHTPTHDWWNELSVEEQKDLTQAREEIKNDQNLLDHDEVMKEAFAWKRK